MTQSKKILGVWVLALAFAVPQAAFAADAFDDTSSTTTTTTTSTGTLSDAGWQAPKPEGKTMAQFVTEAKAGFPHKFTDLDVLDVMSASHKLHDSDRELSQKLERIASKMSSV